MALQIAETDARGLSPSATLGALRTFARTGSIVGLLFTAVEQGVPVLSPYESMVTKSHALLSVAARYRDVVRLAGEQVRRILLEGASPGELPVVGVEKFDYVVDMDTARRLNLLPPVEVLQIAETVN